MTDDYERSWWSYNIAWAPTDNTILSQAFYKDLWIRAEKAKLVKWFSSRMHPLQFNVSGYGKDVLAGRLRKAAFDYMEIRNSTPRIKFEVPIIAQFTDMKAFHKYVAREMRTDYACRSHTLEAEMLRNWDLFILNNWADKLVDWFKPLGLFPLGDGSDSRRWDTFEGWIVRNWKQQVSVPFTHREVETELTTDALHVIFDPLAGFREVDKQEAIKRFIERDAIATEVKCTVMIDHLDLEDFLRGLVRAKVDREILL